MSLTTVWETFLKATNILPRHSPGTPCRLRTISSSSVAYRVARISRREFDDCAFGAGVAGEADCALAGLLPETVEITIATATRANRVNGIWIALLLNHSWPEPGTIVTVALVVLPL